MYHNKKAESSVVRNRHPFIANGWFFYIICIIIVILGVGLLTTIKPTYRISSKLVTSFIEEIDPSVFLWFISFENRALFHSIKEDQQFESLTGLAFEKLMNVKPNDYTSLLKNAVPQMALYDQQIVVAGSGTNYANLSFESSPPLEEILKDREAINDEEKQITEEIKPHKNALEKAVFIYNSHNRESFLPHLPDANSPNDAHHKEVNIQKVSSYLANKLEENGIGATVDDTDIMQKLKKNGWSYSQSYRASRESVVAAMDQNQDLQYFIDIHRDSLPRKYVTTEIEGETYAKILFVVGAEHPNFEKNLGIATKINEMLETKHPSLTRGVITKKGAGSNGIYNQDLSENAMLIEVGGHENTLDEVYRTTDIIAEIFTEYYFSAEKVDISERKEKLK